MIDEGHLETLFNVKLLPISEQDSQRKLHHSLTRAFAAAVGGTDVHCLEHSENYPSSSKNQFDRGLGF